MFLIITSTHNSSLILIIPLYNNQLNSKQMDLLY